MPLAEITFFAEKKCYLSEQRRHFSGQNGVFVGRCRLCGGWGGRCLPFGWKFQSKTDITIRFGASPTLDDPSRCPNDENDEKLQLGK